MSRACSTCGSSDIDFDPSRGDTVCTKCGSVLEESAIVSEVGFQETSAGGTSVIGQFVSNEGNKVGQGLGFRPGYGRESRTVTLENGKRRLQALANQLQLNNHCVESAYMFFKLAVSKRLTKGRRTGHIAAACLYLVCRTEKTPHLLLDFSDVLQVDVVTLGKVYLKLQHELCINLPVVDPCLYIHRFCHQFQLAEKENDVANTALRLVCRMKRDWIQYGRRPSGLCGAAILVAARLHGFSRTIKEVVKVVRLSNTTIRKRLNDFKKTPSGQLTVDEFNTIDLEEEQDPPCFTEARQKQKQQQLNEIEGINKPGLASELEELRKQIDERLAKTKSRWNSKNSFDSNDADISSLGSTISINMPSEDSMLETSVSTSILDDTMDACEKDVCDHDGVNRDKEIEEISGGKEATTEGILEEKENDSAVEEQIIDNEEDGNVEKGAEEDKEENLDDLDDDELDSFILADHEVEVKTKIWMEENKDYLEKQREKEEREAEEREREEADPNKKKRRKPYKRKPKEKANSVGEAVEKMLIEKKISHKINYDVLRNLNKENELEKPTECEPITPSSEPVVSNLIQTVQPSIPVRYTGRKRDKSFLPKLPTKRVKFLDTTLERSAGSMVVESGPVEYADQDHDEIVEEDEEDIHLSAAQLMGQEYGHGNVDEYEDYDNY
ncbi:transcription factor IIIB 90 kDa subunit-like [Dendronephthya gigantea]|uniref:transcription factor IIIB 90 kDa subunit-like n=1 Tax=Dendronephthya gigantea TaxID=151771 RepID=UPI001069370B|nr:transcription factor IIIB 90 kDa subunit-like [Dendronephthya gigantea]